MEMKSGQCRMDLKHTSMMLWPCHLSSLQSGLPFTLLFLRTERKNDPSTSGGSFYHQVYDILITISLNEVLDVFLA